MMQKIKEISILLVEDELELHDMLLEYLQLFFYKTYSAKNGQEALEIYRQKRPQIILSDINMPELSGLELVQTIRKDDLATKIIIMSAHSDQEKLLQAIPLQLETYLIKPIKTETLKNTLLKTVEQIRTVSNRVYVCDNIFWDITTETLSVDFTTIELAGQEKALLKLLFSKPNHTFKAEEIFAYLHTGEHLKKFSSHAITSLIKRLRIKVNRDDFIQNIYGAGYKISTI